jgi:hypothetical protein
MGNRKSSRSLSCKPWTASIGVSRDAMPRLQSGHMQHEEIKNGAPTMGDKNRGLCRPSARQPFRPGWAVPSPQDQKPPVPSPKMTRLTLNTSVLHRHSNRAINTLLSCIFAEMQRWLTGFGLSDWKDALNHRCLKHSAVP